MSGLTPQEHALFRGMAEELQHSLLSLTETTERLTNGIVNHVLEVATRTFPASGCIQREYGATAGSVWVHNHGTAKVVVAAGFGSGLQPSEGVGVYNVASGTAEAVNLGARAFAMYGTPGETVSYQVFTRGGISGQGLLSMDGGSL